MASQPAGYSKTQIALHWIIAVLLIPQFLFNDAIGEAFRTALRGTSTTFDPVVFSHVAIGFLIGLLVLLRLVIRLRRGAPKPPEQEHPLLKIAASVTHWAFYALLVLLPVSGAVAWFGLNHDAGEVHEVLKTILLVLVILHVVGALFHQFYLKTDLITRMKKASA
ncbi:MAG: cytochrome b/b6 domain-containing protein [Nitratireductor sp.]|nr:cytochrome b/b6 domain-containing protein [Nitratireductor sp.]MCC0020810.1 cytochrome b/b6 domain-containing protein [Nitratireductor sp.]